MKYKKYIKSIVGAFIIIIVSMFLIALLHYFNIISTLVVNVIKLVVIFVALFYSGFIMGKNSSKMGYFAGIQAGLIIDVILIIYNLIADSNFSLKTIIFYIILLAISAIGGMFGISRSSISQK